MIKTNLKSQSSCNNFDLNNYLLNNELGASLEISTDGEKGITISLLNKQNKVLNDVSFDVIQESGSALKDVRLDSDNKTLIIEFEDETKESLTCDLSAILQGLLFNSSNTLDIVRNGNIIGIEVKSNLFPRTEELDAKLKELTSNIEIKIEEEADRAKGEEKLLANSIGTLSDLDTTKKDTLVSAINEVNDKINEFQCNDIVIY